MVNQISDDVHLTNTNVPVVLEKVSPVQAVSGATSAPANGKDSHEVVPILGNDTDTRKAASDKEMEDTARELNERMNVIQRELHFSVDKDSGQTVIKVMDLATQQVIRQIPNEEALVVARRIGDGVDLNLFNEYT